MKKEIVFFQRLLTYLENVLRSEKLDYVNKEKDIYSVRKSKYTTGDLQSHVQYSKVNNKNSE